ncbi:SH3 domain-containing YSC84-like protein 1 [Hondaea fermentalgiana]|uniref:SH3 domain-containing YSC84-like protein 1 n=1 Tax=Hondaea fermentalgiana TaxID=2315210 RepID=A0A2R5GS14_9STRA|nr:SH3 domain-containing YSC84-like protein 1 [Hondaea fermentalgiana]|eukprot:GBG33676.1 SH3 domain-containing YSC84-like protein 1 [Hondaea fermentalgiana]
MASMEFQLQRLTQVLHDWLASQPDLAEAEHKLKKAKGLAYITSVKGGCLFSGALGYGIMLKRLDNDDWGGPISLMLASAGVGLQFGLHKTEVVVLMTSSRSIHLFESHGQLRLGGEFAITGGYGLAIKGDAGINRKGISTQAAFAHSTGLFAGVSVDGSLVVSNPFSNWAFYGHSAHVKEILNGQMPVPEHRKHHIEALIRVLDALLKQVRAEIDAQTGSPSSSGAEIGDEIARSSPRIRPIASNDAVET